MEAPNAHAEYQRTQILTAPPGTLVLMLYDGLLRFCDDGRRAIEQQNAEDASRALVRAQDIVAELQSGLDFGAGDVALSLNSLYDFVYRRLTEANVAKDTAPIADAQRVIDGLRQTWEQLLESHGEDECARRDGADGTACNGGETSSDIVA